MLAASIFVLAVTIPITLAIVATQAVASVVGSLTGSAVGVVRWVGLIGVSLIVAWVAGRFTRRLLPLAAIYRMSLGFPGRAPARFQLALQRGSTRQLRRALIAGELDGDAGEAAVALLSLVGQLNAHDRLTRGHSERVRAYSVMIGEELGLSDADLDRLQWAALLHDVGKIEVPADLLNKPGRPDDREWEILRDHPRHAGDLVEPVRPWLGEWVDAATQHHERVDGAGYPAGLRREEITFGARIVAVADAFDTMTAVRSYKVPLPAGQARAELSRAAGAQFDPAVVRAFLSVGLPQLLWVAGPTAALAQIPGLGSLLTTGTTAAPSLSAAVATGAGQVAVAGSVVAVTGVCVATSTLGHEPVIVTTSPSSAGPVGTPPDTAARASDGVARLQANWANPASPATDTAAATTDTDVLTAPAVHDLPATTPGAEPAPAGGSTEIDEPISSAVDATETVVVPDIERPLTEPAEVPPPPTSAPPGPTPSTAAPSGADDGGPADGPGSAGRASRTTPPVAVTSNERPPPVADPQRTGPAAPAQPPDPTPTPPPHANTPGPPPHANTPGPPPHANTPGPPGPVEPVPTGREAPRERQATPPSGRTDPAPRPATSQAAAELDGIGGPDAADRDPGPPPVRPSPSARTTTPPSSGVDAGPSAAGPRPDARDDAPGRAGRADPQRPARGD